MKTVAGTRFIIEVNCYDTVADVKKNIETVQGPVVYPAAQQVLIHKGKILKDKTTLEGNKIAANSSVLVVSLSKFWTKSSASGLSTTSVAPANVISAQPENSIAPSTQASAASHFAHSKPITEYIHAPDVESNIQHLLYRGRGKWDREMVTRAVHATSNNRSLALHYLVFFDNLEEYGMEIPPEVQTPAPAFAFTHQPAAASSGPNAAPLDLFPQRASNVDPEARARIIESLRNDNRFQAFRTKVKANPHRLLPMIFDLSKGRPGLLRVIYENWIDFLRLITEPVKREGNVPRQLAESMPTESTSVTQEEYEATQTESMSITPEESEAIKRLVALGFDIRIVMDAYVKCDKDEELTANWLLEHRHEFED